MPLLQLGTTLAANDTHVHDNTAASTGGGLAVQGTSALRCHRCSLQRNTAVAGGAIAVSGAAPGTRTGVVVSAGGGTVLGRRTTAAVWLNADLASGMNGTTRLGAFPCVVGNTASTTGGGVAMVDFGAWSCKVIVVAPVANC